MSLIVSPSVTVIYVYTWKILIADGAQSQKNSAIFYSPCTVKTQINTLELASRFITLML